MGRGLSRVQKQELHVGGKFHSLFSFKGFLLLNDINGALLIFNQVVLSRIGHGRHHVGIQT